ALVLHHHLLAELARKMLRGEARHHVDPAAGGQRNHELDRTARPGVLPRRRPAQSGKQRECRETAPRTVVHCVPPHLPFVASMALRSVICSPAQATNQGGNSCDWFCSRPLARATSCLAC